ncbi:hypothetical protein ACXGSL_04755 [Vreelandella aquamarina]|uniref:hypothetical protein n=1 Tax=Halomonas sp. Ps84H-12 TaxID=2954501 RepID=UPI002097DB45|nr:hypothetical protein [Halomonas sp. Ps84H-12]MCO7244606.1 hypothetical protein [Halomonas sp. Ps84H-12]
MASPLSDLDELVLRCRDEKAKSYIRESVACYKAGAFRSAIVSTWIAVSFDIIDKLKDLALTGDKEAEKQLEEFEKARQAGDIAKSLKFERDILEIARDKLELISHIEFIDLERLQQDRNRCAHPSMTSDGDIFNPSAELARVHIRSAVEYLLQYPPAQGKYALESLVKEIESEYFPTALDKAIVALKNSPLFRARESLIRNFTIILLKKILGGTSDYKEVMRVSSALKAIAHLHPEVFEGTMGKKFSSLVKSLDDNNLKNSFVALEKIKDSWEYLEPDVKQKLESFVENLPKEDLDELEFLLSHSGLKSAADRRVKYATRSDLGAPAFFILPSLVGDRIVKLYAESQSFEQANSFSSVVVRHAYDYTKGQVERIIRACGNNYEIKESFEVTTVINAMRQNKSVTDEEIDEWLIDVGLKKYTKPVAVE